MNHRIIAWAGALTVATACLVVAPASAQEQGSFITAEQECAPDGSTQGIVITLVNHEGASINLDVTDASGTVYGDGDVHDLTFSPTTVLDGASSTADIALPGTASGSLSVEAGFSVGKGDGGQITGEFTITACAIPVTTLAPTTTAAAEAANATQAQPAFTG